MTKLESAIIKAALELPSRARAALADELWTSLDRSQRVEIDDAWSAEIRKRLNDYRSGRAKPIDGDRVMREAEAAVRRVRKAG